MHFLLKNTDEWFGVLFCFLKYILKVWFCCIILLAIFFGSVIAAPVAASVVAAQPIGNTETVLSACSLGLVLPLGLLGAKPFFQGFIHLTSCAQSFEIPAVLH